ncbi:MAG: RDD family protein [Pseudomonadota bacterium]
MSTEQEENTANTQNVEPTWIAGFWRRIGAFLVDTLVLGIVGFSLGLFLEEQFVRLAGFGELVGFVIASMYFGILNSKIGIGQTLGKQLLKIRVVDAAGECISLPRSIARYSILGVPFFVNGSMLSASLTGPFWHALLSLVIFGGAFSIVYLYVFNRATRQSLHDLIVGTYVVYEAVDPIETQPVWPGHRWVVPLLFAAAAAAPFILSAHIGDESFDNLRAGQSAVMDYPSVRHASVFRGTRTSGFTGTGGSSITFLSSQAFLLTNDVSDANFARQLAIDLAKAVPESKDVDVVVIVLSYGYDIGIASSWRNYTYNFDPAELLRNDEHSSRDET